jgi:PTS system fructose-specific IIC component
MAAAALERAGKKLGHEIKVETQGSMGMRNELTPQEIADADIVVFASDMAVSVERFKAKSIHTVGVAQAVRDSVKVLQEALVAAGK